MDEYKDDRFHIKIEDGIAYVIWLQDHYEYEDVDFGIKKRREITEDKEYVMLSDIRGVKSGSREARQRLSQKDAGEGMKAVAVVVSSRIHRVLYNFFSTIYKDPAPTKLFTDKEAAIKWLQQYK